MKKELTVISALGKKITSLVTCTALVFTLGTTSVFAEEINIAENENGLFYYSVSSNGAVVNEDVSITVLNTDSVPQIHTNPYKVFVNGKEVKLNGYNINGNSYFNLSDISDVIGFKEVLWDGVTFDKETELCNIKDLEFALGIPGSVALAHLGIRDIQYAANIWDNYYLRYKYKIKLYEQVEDVFNKLASIPVHIGVVTSRTRVEYETDETLLPLKKHIEIAICKEDSVKHKPNAEPLNTYLKRADASAETTLYIGDSYYDMASAKGANIDCALAMWNGRHLEPIEATYYLNNITQLLSFINGDGFYNV